MRNDREYGIPVLKLAYDGVQQAQGGKKAGGIVYKSMAHALTHILKTQGVGGLYMGYVPATLKMIPMSGASFATYEMVKRALVPATSEIDPEDDEDDQDDHYVDRVADETAQDGEYVHIYTHLLYTYGYASDYKNVI